MVWLIGWTVLLASVYLCSASSSVMGPYELKLKYLEKCKVDRNYSRYFDIYSRNINGSRILINYNMSYPFDIDDSVQLFFVGGIKRNGIWKNNLFVQKFNNGCQAFYDLILGILENFTLNMNGKPYTCPLVKGPQATDDVVIPRTVRLPNVKTFFYGSIRADLKHMRKGRIIQCFRVYVDSVPK